MFLTTLLKSPEALINPVFIDAIAVVDDFVDFGITFVESKLGPVEPIGDIYLGVVNTLCHTYLDEFNMAWAAIGFVLVFSVPMMISACCLESIFRRRAAGMERFGNEPSSRGGRMMNALALNRPKKQKRARNLGESHNEPWP